MGVPHRLQFATLSVTRCWIVFRSGLWPPNMHNNERITGLLQCESQTHALEYTRSSMLQCNILVAVSRLRGGLEAAQGTGPRVFDAVLVAHLPGIGSASANRLPLPQCSNDAINLQVAIKFGPEGFAMNPANRSGKSPDWQTCWDSNAMLGRLNFLTSLAERPERWSDLNAPLPSSLQGGWPLNLPHFLD